jgi:RND family efflux transporter MFP subunit
MAVSPVRVESADRLAEKVRGRIRGLTHQTRTIGDAQLAEPLLEESLMVRLMQERVKALRNVAVGFTLASLATSGCSPQAGEMRTPPPPVVSVIEARKMTVPVIAEPIGTTKALQEVSIRARVRGFLKEMHFREGADVKKDQLLFVIDEEPFKAELAMAEAKLEQAEASFKKAKDSKDREVATAQVGVGKAMLNLSEVEERRERNLLKRNATSMEDVQRKEAMREKDVAQLDAEKARLEQANADYDTNRLSTQADVNGAKAQVTEARINLSYCRMFSPIDGRVGLAQVKVGNLVGPLSAGGSQDYTELAVVRQLDPLGVDIQVASRYLDEAARLIAGGIPVEVFRPGLEQHKLRRLPGKITVIDNTIDSTTSTFKAQAEVANPEKTVLPGEYVKATIKVSELVDAIVVPEQSVIETQAGPTVYTVDEQGKVSVLPVQATVTYEGLRVLESGLEAGRKVIVEGMQLVRAGMTVKAEPVSLETLRESRRPAQTAKPSPAAATVAEPKQKP